MVLLPVAGIRHDYIIDPTEGRVVIVSDLSVTAFDDSSITVQFTEVDDGQGAPADYQVLVREKGVAAFVLQASELGTTIGATKSIKTDLLDPGTTYEITVRAIRFENIQAFFSAVLEQATSASAVPQPTNLATTSVAPGQVSLTVTDNGGTGFSWERRDLTNEGAFAEVDTTGDGVNTFDDVFAFVVDTEYEWRVFATDAGPIKSAPSNTTSATPVIETPTQPGTVTDLAFVSDTDTTVDLDLTEVDDGTGNPADYVVRFWLSADANPAWGFHSASEFTVNGVTIAATLQFSVSGLTPATAYQFQCSSFRGTLNVDAVFGALSNIITETTDADTQTVLAPTALSATIVSTQAVDFPFTDNATNETGFSLHERNATENGTFAQIETDGVNAGTGSVTISHDKGSVYDSNDLYEARVKATGSPDSAWSNVVSYRPNPNVPSDTFKANEPAGMTQLTSIDMSEICQEGWGCTASYQASGNLTRPFTDASAPHSPPDVAQYRFKEGFGGGERGSGFSPVPSSTKTFSSGISKFYLQVYFQVSANWFGHPVGTLKFFNLRPRAAGGGQGQNKMIMSINGSESNPLAAWVKGQGFDIIVGGTQHRTPNLTTSEITRGEYHNWEIIAEINTPGVADGKLDWWLNGIKQASHSDLGWQASDEPAEWASTQINLIYGGRGDHPLPAEQFLWIDHIYISESA